MTIPLRERYDLIVFDLDGTLVDSIADLATSLNHALRTLGIAPLDLETVARYVGDGARKLVARALGEESSAARVDAGLASFLEHYAEECTHRTVLYPGAREALDTLRAPRGNGSPNTLAVLTNKPIRMTERILAALGVREAFARVLGGDDAPARKPDPAGLRAIMAALAHAPWRTLLVGDSLTDARTGAAAEVDVALVDYGFQPSSLEAGLHLYRLSDLRDLLRPRRDSRRSAGTGNGPEHRDPG